MGLSVTRGPVVINFSVLPPEINSTRLFSGAGSAPMLAAAAAWDGFADEPGSAASSLSFVSLARRAGGLSCAGRRGGVGRVRGGGAGGGVHLVVGGGRGGGGGGEGAAGAGGAGGGRRGAYERGEVEAGY